MRPAIPCNGSIVSHTGFEVEPFGDFVAGAKNIDPGGDENGTRYRLGADLDRIYVTTLGRPYYGAEPGSADAGRTLMIDGSGCRGCPQPRFRG